MENQISRRVIRDFVRAVDLPRRLPFGVAGTIAEKLGKAEPVVRQTLRGEYVNPEILMAALEELSASNEIGEQLRGLLERLNEQEMALAA